MWGDPWPRHWYGSVESTLQWQGIQILARAITWNKGIYEGWKDNWTRILAQHRFRLQLCHKLTWHKHSARQRYREAIPDRSYRKEDCYSLKWQKCSLWTEICCSIISNRMLLYCLNSCWENSTTWETKVEKVNSTSEWAQLQRWTVRHKGPLCSYLKSHEVMDQQYQNRAKISGPTPYKMSVAPHFLNKEFHNNLFFFFIFSSVR